MTITRVPVVERILSANDRLAEQNRARLDAARVLGINIMASPGAGKTSTILQTIKALSPRVRIGVVEGDTAPVTIDADKIIAAGMPAVQVNTGGECHLDAVMLGNALPQLPLDQIDLLIIENVGNLICPAAFTLGTHLNVLIASTSAPRYIPGYLYGLSSPSGTLAIKTLRCVPSVKATGQIKLPTFSMMSKSS